MTRVLILGYGVNNRPLVPYWLSQGASVTVADQRATVAGSDAPGVRWALGPSYVDQAVRWGPYDRVYVTPGIPSHSEAVRRLARGGALVTCETDLFLEQCPAPVLGITGSAGKTTTTTLLGAMLAQDGSHPVYVGGNIGTSLRDQLGAMRPDDWVVMELSSFQLELVTRSPAGAALLNLSPNHLDHHRDMADYAAAKAHIFEFQHPDDWLVTDREPPALLAPALARHRGRRYFVATEGPVAQGAAIQDGWIAWRPEPESAWQRVLPLDRWHLPGRMNVHNALVATAMALVAGARVGAVAEALAAFHGVPHRLELVAEAGGIRYVNDSIATAPDRTLAALDALPGSLVLVAGGYDKHLDYGELGRALAARARVVVLAGPTASAIARAMRQADPAGAGAAVVLAASFDDAVATAIAQARSGDTVLLSPASASYDAFANFEERGVRFRDLVHDYLSGRRDHGPASGPGPAS